MGQEASEEYNLACLAICEAAGIKFKQMTYAMNLRWHMLNEKHHRCWQPLYNIDTKEQAAAYAVEFYTDVGAL